MALNIKDRETEELARDVAEMTGDSKTGAVRKALRERRDRLALRAGRGKREPGSLRRFLEPEIWPLLPEEELDQPPNEQGGGRPFGDRHWRAAGEAFIRHGKGRHPALSNSATA